MAKCLFVRGPLIERGRAYKWTQGWCWVNPDTGNPTYPAMTRDEARAFAEKQGEVPLFIKAVAL